MKVSDFKVRLNHYEDQKLSLVIVSYKPNILESIFGVKPNKKKFIGTRKHWRSFGNYDKCNKDQCEKLFNIELTERLKG